ncbi:MAG: phosphoenolpyruvate--protein phosphotransferase [Myxococcales bacterium]|nr:phosphoenolpyruvate--protein phosphotransferase [Myxococcales bacterium]
MSDNLGTFPPPSAPDVTVTETVKGIAGAPGVAVGTALVIGEMRAAYTRRNVHTAQIEGELLRVREAADRAKETLRLVAARLPVETAKSQVSILDAYLAMLDDPMLHERVAKKIRGEKKGAEWAVASAAEEILAMFERAPKDAYIAERRHDVEFVCDQLMRALRGEIGGIIPKLDAPTIIVARDLSPADTAGMVREPVLAFVTEVGSRTSHTSIMARALEIPAVVGVAGALNSIRTGDTIIVDGLRGEVTIAPNEAAVAEARARSARHLEFARTLLSARNEPCVLASGEAVVLKANVEMPAEAVLAVDHGAQGIGLYRTEFLYIDRLTPPSEDEQYEVYRAVVEAVGDHPVTLRTFDIGGDKFVSSFPVPEEMNPALGLRAVRLALSRPDVFLVQLRAMLRAAVHGDVRIMVPMITTTRELREVRALLARAARELVERDVPHGQDVPLGMMVEVPSAAVLADVFARHVDFFSIGTNDLLQYSLAIDRTSRSLASLASPFDPSILRLVHNVARVGLERPIPVALCGAMASDPLAAALLVGLGLRELSMEAAAIPEIKEALRRISLQEAEEAARECLLQEAAEAVEACLASRFALRFFDLLAGGPEEALSRNER